MSNEMKNIIDKIEYLKELICHSENNLQYIKRLQALKYWLVKLDTLLGTTHDSIYQKYFYSAMGDSFFDRICLSIIDYQYGNRPFN